MPPTKDGLPLDMLPGDTLVHHWNPPDLFNKVVTGVEDWGEYDGAPGQDLQANHVEGQFSLLQVARMNPPHSLLYPVADAPWPIIRRLRLDVKDYFPGVPRFPGRDPGFVATLQLEINANLGQPYGWSVIIGFAPVGIISRIWPWLGQQIVKRANPVELVNGHAQVCSLWWRARLENSMKKQYGINFDLFDGTIGQGQENPADFERSRYLTASF